MRPIPGHPDFRTDETIFAMELADGWAEIGLRTLALADGDVFGYTGPTGRHFLVARDNRTTDISTVVMYDGGKWVVLGGMESALTVGGAGDDVWFAGMAGEAIRITPSGRETTNVGTTNALIAVRAFASDNAVTVDTDGGVYVWDGDDWSTHIAPTDLSLADAYIGTADDIWGADTSDMVRLVEGVWTRSNNSIHASHVVGFNTDDVFAIELSRLHHWDGNTWSMVSPPGDTGARWTQLQTFASGEAAAITSVGELLMYDGSDWRVAYDGLERLVPALAGTGPDDLWLFELDVGRRHATDLHWDGVVLSPARRPQRPLALFERGANDVMVIDADGTLYGYDGLAFSVEAERPAPDSRTFFDALFLAPDDIWAVTNATQYRFDGTTWRDQSDGTFQFSLPVSLQRLFHASSGEIIGAGLWTAILSRR